MIEIADGLIMFYGSRAGYVDGQTAVIDCIFRRAELIDFLSGKQLKCDFRDGINEMLSSGKTPPQTVNFKTVRLYRLKSSADIAIKFIPLSDLTRKGEMPKKQNYELTCERQTADCDMAKIEEILSEKSEVKMSDIIEIADERGSSFFYADRYGYKKINEEEFI